MAFSVAQYLLQRIFVRGWKY